MENVTKNPCREHYSHRCEDCEHCKETKMYFKDGIFEVEERGYECKKFNVFSSKKEMKRYPVYNTTDVTGEMARKHIRFAIKYCESASNEYVDFEINGVTVHVQKDMKVVKTGNCIEVNAYLHAPVHSGGTCYEDGKPYPSCPFMYNVGVSKIEVVDKSTVDMYLQDDITFFNGWTSDRLELALDEVWIDDSEKFQTSSRTINRWV